MNLAKGKKRTVAKEAEAAKEAGEEVEAAAPAPKNPKALLLSKHMFTKGLKIPYKVSAARSFQISNHTL